MMSVVLRYKYCDFHDAFKVSSGPFDLSRHYHAESKKNEGLLKIDIVLALQGIGFQNGMICLKDLQSNVFW
jgi:hypothetical protein